jgi:hypothetical protein
MELHFARGKASSHEALVAGNMPRVRSTDFSNKYEQFYATIKKINGLLVL